MSTYNTLLANKIIRQVALVVLLLAVFIAPRAVALDQYVTIDETSWLMHSANFYYGIATRNFEYTYQIYHPGVTTMWAGTIGMLLQYPEYRGQAPGHFDNSPELKFIDFYQFIEAQGQDPLQLLTSMRLVIFSGQALGMLVVYFLARKLFGGRVALFSFLLIAFEPFYFAHSRFLNQDGTLTIMMLLSLLALFLYLWQGRSRLMLALSGAAAALAWLTKSPTFFLIPFVGLVLLVEAFSHWWSQPDRKRNWLPVLWRELVLPMLIWLAAGALTYTLVWPAMWVDPGGAVGSIFSVAVKRFFKQGGGVPSPQVLSPGLFSFGYLNTYIRQSSPLTLLGILCYGAAFVRHAGLLADSSRRKPTIWLVVYAALFAVFMTIAGDKAPRYVLPSFPPLDIIAAIGWLEVFRLLTARLTRPLALKKYLPLAAAVLFAALYLQPLISTYPYYIHYTSPLRDRPKTIPEMSIGWGEGLDQAARYLNQKPNAHELSAMSWYGLGPFSFFFEGQWHGIRLGVEWRGEDADILKEMDYLVMYGNQWRRNMPAGLLLALEGAVPEHTVWIDGFEYVRIYAVETLPEAVFNP
ncbi:glycosyltransferase family 39 protein [Chloroflexota bacterium]